MSFERVELGLDVTLYYADCLDVLPTLADASVDAVVTDPPYPDIEKTFSITPIEFLKAWPCRQLVFWSAVAPFPLDYTAIHIWHKPNGNSSQHYERIFERNGQGTCRVFRVAAILPNYTQYRAECVDHPTQKPLRLMRELLYRYTQPSQSVVDFFMGSGTTGVACVQTGRRFIGIEIEEKYFRIAVKRITEAQMQMRLPLE